MDIIGIKGRDVCNLLLNGSAKTIMCVHAYTSVNLSRKK